MKGPQTALLILTHRGLILMLQPENKAIWWGGSVTHACLIDNLEFQPHELNSATYRDTRHYTVQLIN